LIDRVQSLARKTRALLLEIDDDAILEPTEQANAYGKAQIKPEAAFWMSGSSREEF